jgi:hypothetical protein
MKIAGEAPCPSDIRGGNHPHGRRRDRKAFSADGGKILLSGTPIGSSAATRKVSGPSRKTWERSSTPRRANPAAPACRSPGAGLYQPKGQAKGKNGTDHLPAIYRAMQSAEKPAVPSTGWAIFIVFRSLRTTVEQTQSSKPSRAKPKDRFTFAEPSCPGSRRARDSRCARTGETLRLKFTTPPIKLTTLR